MCIDFYNSVSAIIFVLLNYIYMSVFEQIWSSLLPWYLFYFSIAIVAIVAIDLSLQKICTCVLLFKFLLRPLFSSRKTTYTYQFSRKSIHPSCRGTRLHHFWGGKYKCIYTYLFILSSDVFQIKSLVLIVGVNRWCI